MWPPAGSHSPNLELPMLTVRCVTECRKLRIRAMTPRRAGRRNLVDGEVLLQVEM